MTLVDEYRMQYAWRDWQSCYELLPPIAGAMVLDLGCAIGDHSADLVDRGACVVGVDLNEELLVSARSRRLPRAEFIAADLRQPFDLPPGSGARRTVDGIWSSFVAAYFVDLPAAILNWARHLRPGGWIALTEIDDLFAHEPVSHQTRDLLESYVQESLAAGRYDFRMGRKLSAYLKAAGFTMNAARTIADQEFSRHGPASPEVLSGWQRRLDRMKLLQAHCGEMYSAVRDDFLSCLASHEHRSYAQVCFCMATRH